MSFWNKNKEEEVEPKGEETLEEEFNIGEAVKGMSEKQLLKLLVLLFYDKNIESFDDWDEIIKIAREE